MLWEGFVMKAVIVFDSFFGNTEKVAKAIGVELEVHGEVLVGRVNEISSDQLQGIDLLVVGSPTRAFSMSPGTKDFLSDVLGRNIQGVKVAAFDTRMLAEDVNNAFYTFFSRLFGFAAQKIAARLENKGGELVLLPQGFAVPGAEGPLKDGELERAAAWGKQMVEKM
jgi:flavodoxin I